MRLQPIYVNDTIGLRTLDERGDLVLETCEGQHMELSDCWEPLVKKYVGGHVDSGSQNMHLMAEQEVLQVSMHS